MNLEAPSSQLRPLKEAGLVSCYDYVLGLVGFVDTPEIQRKKKCILEHSNNLIFTRVISMEDHVRFKKVGKFQ